jgi:hypothetical protein
MARINKDDALELSRLTVALANEIGDLRVSRWSSSSEPEDRSLADLQWDLLSLSTRLETAAVGAILDDAQASIKRIKNAIGDAKDAVNTMKDIQKAVSVGTAVVVLAGAIVTQNPNAIGSALAGLVSAII